ncbi:MAG: GFA family protein [Pseudomonadota bacterium]
MLLKGSCHCKAVRFTVRSHTPVPYMHCYCSICRKTAGGSGAAINIMGEADSLKVAGKANVAVYRARLSPRARTRSPGRRHFCRRCGSALWVWDPRWPQWVYPFASAIDSKLPAPPERQHIFLGSRAGWALVPKGPREKHFREYPRESILDWHRKRGLLAR